MENLRLADEVRRAAEYISTHEDTDVEIFSADGSASLYIKGEEVSPVWFAGPMPEMAPGEPATYLDLTPSEIRLGRWDAERERFITSRSLTVDGFLELFRSATQNASQH